MSAFDPKRTSASISCCSSEVVNAGLIVAEVELTSEDQALDMPAWIGEEVTGDPRYYNANLIKNPFTRWS